MIMLNAYSQNSQFPGSFSLHMSVGCVTWDFKWAMSCSLLVSSRLVAGATKVFRWSARRNEILNVKKSSTIGGRRSHFLHSCSCTEEINIYAKERFMPLQSTRVALSPSRSSSFCCCCPQFSLVLLTVNIRKKKAK